LTFDNNSIENLRDKQRKYEVLNEKCQSGKFPIIDSLKSSIPCLLMKNFEPFVGLFSKEDELDLLNSNSNTTRTLTIDQNKIESKKISVVDKFSYFCRSNINYNLC